MKDNPLWLFLEPYVHLLLQEDGLLLYNTITKAALEFSPSKELKNLAKELMKPDNGYVVPLSQIQLQDDQIQEFISRIREYFMGDLLDVAWSEGRPANIFPEPVVKFGLNPAQRQKSSMKPDIDLRNYLQEITLFLNSGRDEAINTYQTAYRQFSFPAITTRNGMSMDFDLFRTIIDDVNNYTPTLIHVSGFNLTSYPFLGGVIEVLASSPFQKKYHFLAENWDERLIPLILGQKNTTIAIYITFPLGMKEIEGYLKGLPDRKSRKKVEFNFIVSTREELQDAMETIGSTEPENVFLKPFFTGDNLAFFKENVFVSKEEILNAQPDQKQVFSRISINENDFGKLSVFPGGEVYANLNDPMIGEATSKSLLQLVTNELENGISWRRIRPQVSPCNHCLYQFLCPPISSYEIYMERFNFCDVTPKGSRS